MVAGVFTVYFALFATGYWIYGRTATATVLSALTVVGIVVLFMLWNRLRSVVADEAHEILPAEVEVP